MKTIARAIRTHPAFISTGRTVKSAYWGAVVMPRMKRHGKRRTALASFPRSGNTWARSLIEAVTGEQLGSKYNDALMARDREGIAIKTHGLDSYAYTHAIHIVRNPFDAVWSFYKWSRDFQHQHVEWQSFSRRAAAQWDRHTKHWLAVSKPVLFVRFEEIREQPVAQLRRMSEFLQRTPTEDALAAAVEACGIEKLREKTNDEAGSFFRQGSIGQGVRHFDQQQVEDLLHIAARTMQRVGYQPPDDDHPALEQRREHAR